MGRQHTPARVNNLLYILLATHYCCLND